LKRTLALPLLCQLNVR